MAQKISGLTALSTTYADTDLLEVSVDTGGGTFVSRKMTFLQLRTAFTKLQANLDVNSFQITSASNGNIIIRPNGSGAVLVGGNSTQATELRFMEDSDNGTNYVALKVANALAASTTYTLPTADGTSGQVLSTNGSGTLSWSTAGSSSGKFGIPDSTGAYTFYSTLGAAITAATAGQTIEFFTDYTETGSVEITLKDGVNISGNGHTYTLNNSGTIHAFKTANSVAIECSIFNLNVVRTGGTAQQSQNASLYVGTSTSGNIYLRGSRFINNGSGSGIAIGGSSTISIYDGYANANTAFGSIYFESSAGAKAINCVGISNTQVGISCYIGGDLYRCYGQSNSNVGIDGSGATGIGSQYDCTGVSTSSAGMTTGAKAVNCTGISVSGNGINSGARVYNSTGISTSGRGISNGSGILYNCTAISSSNVGVLLQSTGGTMHNCVTQSESSYTIWGWAGSAVYNSTIICNWNNAGGNGIQGIGGSITPIIINCTFKLSNASAPYLENGGTAQAISMRGNTYQGGAAFNANLTQAITATEDNQGNIFL